MSGRAGLVVLVSLGLVLAACTPARQLDATFESDEALARAVLDSINRSDGAGLLALAVTREEFADIVWPTLRVSRPEVGMPFDYVWDDTFSKSRNHLIQTLAEHGGRRYELERLEFGGAVTEHATHTIARAAGLVVRDETGRQRRLRLFGSIIRQGGRSKVLSYIVD
jgi:hypothetical protein